MYYSDTAQVDMKGHAVFAGDTALNIGKYAFVFPNFNFLQLIVDEQHFSVKTDTADYYGAAQATNSPNNALYFDYFRFVTKMNKAKNVLIKEKDNPNTSAARVAEIEKTFADYETQIKKKLKEEHDKHKGTFYGDIIGLNRPIDVPDAPVDGNGEVMDKAFQYNFYKKHYFDHTNFKNPNIFRTPEYQTKIDDYFNRVIPQVPDSMPSHIDNFMKEVTYDNELMSYSARKIAALYKKSKYMGMEIGYVHVVENYFDPEKMTTIEKARITDAMEEAQDMKHTLLGNIAPDINLHDPSGKNFQSLHGLKAPYTLLYIWSPTCSHCLEENPDVINFNNRFAAKGVKVYAVCADQELEDWKKYLQNNPQFAKMLNLADSPGNRSKFRNLYNSRTTPVVLLLDENKKILTKRMNVKQVSDFLDNLMK